MTLTISPRVATALAGSGPVVALETTLVSHGFPQGRGAVVAIEAEAAVREAGATPATVGLIDGEVRVGLAESDLHAFSQRPDARKVGARDLASCLVASGLGATTVGGTLAICRAANIEVFATGGLGGVHRDYANHLDVSSDLFELARSHVIVVSSGVKTLLDVDATVEALETLSVPVVGWQTDLLPLFYSADGGPPIDRVDSTTALAVLARTHWALGGNGIILARPPDPSIPTAQMTGLFETALAAAKAAGVAGGAVTPFVLAHVHDASDGATLDVNHRLIVDNAALAADAAIALVATQI